MALRQSKLYDTWPIEDHSVWDHERMLQWICSLNPKFYQRYYNSFTIAKVNGVDFQLLTDTDYLFFVLSLNDYDSSSFSTVLLDRIYKYNMSKHRQSQHIQKQPSQPTLFETCTQPQNSLSPKQEYQFLTNGAIHVRQSSSSTLDVNGAVIIDYATKTKPKTQLQPPQIDMNAPTYFSDGTGPELPPSKSMLIAAADLENKQNIDSDSDDDLYIEPLEPLDIKSPLITGAKFSTYDTPTGHNNLIPDSESDDDDLYNVYQTKGPIHVNQSSSSTLTDMTGAVIDYARKQQHVQQNSLAELHQHSGGIAQLLICDDDNDFKQFDIQMDECQKIWDKHRELDANIQMQWSVTYDNNRSVSLQCLKKLERLLTVIGGPAAVTAFFNINAEISQTVLQTLILSVHINKNEYKIFNKLMRTPPVTQKQVQTQQQMDYNVMSIDVDIEYSVIIENENQYKQTLINELAVVLGIHASFIEILSSMIGVGGCWHLDIEVVMWPYLYSLKGLINDNSNCRKRDILEYKFEIGDRLDVKKQKKWYICKIKAITIDDKLQQEKGKHIRIRYIGKYVNRNGERMKEMGKPFKLKNTEWIWTIADKKRIRVKQLNVAESMMDNFLKIAFKADQDRPVSRHSRQYSYPV